MAQSHDIPPFSFQFTPSVSDLLGTMGSTLAFSTYQAGKVVFLSSVGEGRLVQLPRTFPRPMGFAISGNRLAVATQTTVEVLEHCPTLAPDYPVQPKTYDTLYVPRATYYCGHNNLHDLDWGKDALWAVNTEFSCLCTIDDRYSFRRHWQPPFISEIAPEDRCHLNGMAMEDGMPRYVTALGTGDTAKSWRQDRLHTGMVMEVPSGEILANGLPIPHSPRLINGELFVLLSATGELVRIDRKTGGSDTVAQCSGYVRGLDYFGGYFFIGHSRVREENAATCPFPILKQRNLMTGVAIVEAQTGKEFGRIEYASSVEDIYDVKILPGIRRPGILNASSEYRQNTLVTEETSYWVDITKK